jgi:hypothetical protein
MAGNNFAQFMVIGRMYYRAPAYTPSALGHIALGIHIRD